MQLAECFECSRDYSKMAAAISKLDQELLFVLCRWGDATSTAVP